MEKLPDDIAKLICFYDWRIAFSLRHINRYYRTLLTNYDWYLIFINIHFFEQYDRDKNYCRRVVWLANNEVSTFGRAVAVDQVKLLSEKLFYTIDEEQDGEAIISDKQSSSINSDRRAIISDICSSLTNRNQKVDIAREILKSWNRMGRAIHEEHSIVGYIHDSLNKDEVLSEEYIEVVKLVCISFPNDDMVMDCLGEINPITAIGPQYLLSLVMKIESPYNTFLIWNLLCANDLESVKILLQASFDYIEPIELGPIPFSPEALRLLSTHGISFHIDTDNFAHRSVVGTDIYRLIAGCNIATLSLIIDRLRDQEGSWFSKLLLIALSSQYCKIETVKYLLDDHEKLPEDIHLYPDIESSKGRGNDFLCCFLSSKDVEVLQYLIEKGLDITGELSGRLLENMDLHPDMFRYLISIGVHHQYINSPENPLWLLLMELRQRDQIIKIAIESGFMKTLLDSSSYQRRITVLADYVMRMNINDATDEALSIIYDNIRYLANQDTINSPNSMTPIMRAIYSQNIGVIDLLLSLGADPSLPSPKSTAIHSIPITLAACRGNRAILDKLLSHYPDRVDLDDEMNDLLNIGEYGTALDLVYRGANPRNATILNIGDKTFSRSVQQHHAMPNCWSLDIFIRCVPIHLITDKLISTVIRLGIYNVISAIIWRNPLNISGRYRGIPHLHMMVLNIEKFGPHNEINILHSLATCFDPDLLDDNGNTLLATAVINRKTIAYGSIIQLSKNIYLPDRDGMTPMRIAVKNNDRDSMRTLLLSGYDIKEDCTFSQNAEENAYDILAQFLSDSHIQDSKSNSSN